MQVLDRLSMSELDDFEEFRKRAFSYLYFCPKCTRSFDSADRLEKCRFCGGAVQKLWSSPEKAKAAEKSYRYYCTRCEKNFFSGAKPESCAVCGSLFIHAYEWKRIRRDVFRTRFRRMLRKVRDLEKMQLPKKKGSGKKLLGGVRINYPLPRIKFRRNIEELPTR